MVVVKFKTIGNSPVADSLSLFLASHLAPVPNYRGVLCKGAQALLSKKEWQLL